MRVGHQSPQRVSAADARPSALTSHVITGLSGETVALDLLDSPLGSDVDKLRAILRISHAVLGVDDFAVALEVIAEQTLVTLNAASFSVSR